MNPSGGELDLDVLAQGQRSAADGCKRDGRIAVVEQPPNHGAAGLHAPVIRMTDLTADEVIE